MYYENSKLNNASLKEQLAAVTVCSWQIQFIKNPCLEVQLEAVRIYAHSIQFIKNPHPKVQFEAVKKNPRLIQYIDNPCLEVLLLAYFAYVKIKEDSRSPTSLVKKYIIKKMKSFLKEKQYESLQS
jgi:hypothetical protein